MIANSIQVVPGVPDFIPTGPNDGSSLKEEGPVHIVIDELNEPHMRTYTSSADRLWNLVNHIHFMQVQIRAKMRLLVDL